MTKRLDLILNGKGGVGKSFFAVNFVQYLKDKNVRHIACDSDNENSTLKRFHKEAEYLELAEPRALDAMFRAFEKTDLVVVDCRAASSDLFFDYFDLIDLRATLNALSIVATVILPVNHEADSVEQLQRVVKRLEDVAGDKPAATELIAPPGQSFEPDNVFGLQAPIQTNGKADIQRKNRPEQPIRMEPSNNPFKNIDDD